MAEERTLDDKQEGALQRAERSFAAATETMARAGREIERLRGIIANMLVGVDLADAALESGELRLAATAIRDARARSRGYESAPDA